MVETTEQIVREAPEIEAFKIGLLQEAEALTNRGIKLPPQLVAQLSGLQQTALQGVQQGIGNYQPYLQEAGYTLGDAQTALGGVMQGALPFQQQAAQAMQTGLANVPGQVSAAQQGIQNALSSSQLSAKQAQADARRQAFGGQTGLAAASEAGIGAYEQAIGGIGDVMGSARAVSEAARTGSQGAAQQAAAQQAAAIQGARGITSQAAQALQQAGALGTTAAQQGIAGLAGTTAAFDPASTGGFMNQFEDAAVQQALSDIARQGQIARQGVAAQAVGAGAFGGSRQAVAEQELSRNILDQQGRTAAQMRQAGFESAAQRAQAAFEAQQGRGQQAAQITGSLGAQGAQAGLSAAQAAGQLGLSAEQLAAQAAQQQGQLGLSAEQLAAQTGLSVEQLAQAGVLGAGQMGLQSAGLSQTSALQGSQLGMNAAQMAQQGALQGGQLGLQGSQQAGALGLQGQELMGRLGEGLGALGTQYGTLGLQQGEALSALGVRQAGLGELAQGLGQKEQAFLFDMGKTQQTQQQSELEAQRQSELQQLYEPYQRLGFLSDIYKGAPSTQQAITASTAPSASLGQQLVGLGTAAVSAAAGARREGLI